MLSIELESILGAVVHAFLVGEEVGVNSHLCDDWAVLEELLLDAQVILSEAVVNDLVDHVVSAALVHLEMLVQVALGLVGLVGVAGLGNEALALAPG